MRCLGTGFLVDSQTDEQSDIECGDEGRQCDACAEAEYKYWRAYFNGMPKRPSECLHCGDRHPEGTPYECESAILRAAL